MGKILDINAPEHTACYDTTEHARTRYPQPHVTSITDIGHALLYSFWHIVLHPHIAGRRRPACRKLRPRPDIWKALPTPRLGRLP